MGRAPLKLLVNFVFQRDEESCQKWSGKTKTTSMSLTKREKRTFSGQLLVSWDKRKIKGALAQHPATEEPSVTLSEK